MIPGIKGVRTNILPANSSGNYYWYAEDDYSVEEDWNSEESESKDSVEETAKSAAAGVDPKP